jgi:hypothetical protein
MIKMIEPDNKIKPKRTVREGDGWVIYCPGCKYRHKFRYGWSFNGDTERPTFNPSLVIKLVHEEKTRCHSFVRDGKIEFLNDCQHELAGKTVELPILDETGRIVDEEEDLQAEEEKKDDEMIMQDMPKKKIEMIEPEVYKKKKEDKDRQDIKMMSHPVFPKPDATEGRRFEPSTYDFGDGDWAANIAIWFIVGMIVFGAVVLWNVMR